MVLGIIIIFWASLYWRLDAWDRRLENKHRRCDWIEQCHSYKTHISLCSDDAVTMLAVAWMNVVQRCVAERDASLL